MTAKEKARELVEKFHEHSYNPNPFFNTKEEVSHDKDCALIAVDEILKLKMINHMGRDDNHSEGEFWKQVKKEILRLIKNPVINRDIHVK